VLTGGPGADTFIFSTEVVWLRRDGVDQEAASSSAFFNRDHYILSSDGFYVADGIIRSAEAIDIIAIPRVWITDFSSEDTLIVDGKIISGSYLHIDTQYTPVDMGEWGVSYYGGWDTLVRDEWSWRSGSLLSGIEDDQDVENYYPTRRYEVNYDIVGDGADTYRMHYQTESYEFGSNGKITLFDLTVDHPYGGSVFTDDQIVEFKNGLEINILNFSSETSGIVSTEEYTDNIVYNEEYGSAVSEQPDSYQSISYSFVKPGLDTELTMQMSIY